MSPIEDDREYTLPEAAELLGLTYAGVRSAIRDKRITPARKIGKRLTLVRGSEIRRFRTARESSPQAQGWVTRRADADAAADIPPELPAWLTEGEDRP